MGSPSHRRGDQEQKVDFPSIGWWAARPSYIPPTKAIWRRKPCCCSATHLTLRQGSVVYSSGMTSFWNNIHIPTVSDLCTHPRPGSPVPTERISEAWPKVDVEARKSRAVNNVRGRSCRWNTWHFRVCVGSASRYSSMAFLQTRR